MDGISVKVIWMRKDDIQHGYCHIVSAERIGRQPRQQQQLVAWRHRSGARRRSRRSGIGFVDVPFDMCNLRCENGEEEAHHLHWLIPLAVQRPVRCAAEPSGTDQ